MSARTLTFGILAAIVGFSCVPVLAAAQSSDLEAAIYAATADRARAEGVSDAEARAMASILAEAAAERGVIASDVFLAASDASGTESCAYPRFLCAINDAFGFSGGNRVPLILGVLAALLIILIAEYRRHVASVPAL